LYLEIQNQEKNKKEKLFNDQRGRKKERLSTKGNKAHGQYVKKWKKNGGREANPQNSPGKRVGPETLWCGDGSHSEKCVASQGPTDGRGKFQASAWREEGNIENFTRGGATRRFGKPKNRMPKTLRVYKEARKEISSYKRGRTGRKGQLPRTAERRKGFQSPKKGGRYA